MIVTILKILSTILVLFFFNAATAKTINNCTISMEDVNTGSVYKVKGKRYIENSIGAMFAGTEVIEVDFSLPSKGYSKCLFKYVDIDSGTMLSCRFDELGNHYVQSDRTTDDDKPRKNSLTIRYKDLHFDINAVCE